MAASPCLPTFGSPISAGARASLRVLLFQKEICRYRGFSPEAALDAPVRATKPQTMSNRSPGKRSATGEIFQSELQLQLALQQRRNRLAALSCHQRLAELLMHNAPRQTRENTHMLIAS